MRRLSRSTVEGSPTVIVGPFEEFPVDVFVDGVPGEGIKMDFHGAVSGRFFFSQRTDKLGRTSSYPFTASSRVRIDLDSPEHWWDLPFMDIQPGRNVVRLTRRGTVSGGSEGVLRGLVSLNRGGAVGQWIDDGRTQLIQDERGRWSCRIPVGRYSMAGGGAEPRIVQLGADEPLNL